MKLRNLKPVNAYEWLFGAALLFNLWTAAVGWRNTIFDMHRFRQTQTAISVWSLLEGGPWLLYETPVLGAPWAIPMEFPLYQWIVAALVAVFNANIEQTGRFVSKLFFYLTLFPVYGILAEFAVEKSRRLLVLTLLLVSPIYLYWSRTFMIETTALFLGMTYLWFATRYAARARMSDAVAGTSVGVLAALVKVTTFFGAGLAAGLVTLWGIFGAHERRKNRFVFALVAAVAFAAAPVAVFHQWNKFADSHKAQHPLGYDLTSENLKVHNFGTPAKRESMEVWKTIVLSNILQSGIGGWDVLLASFLASFFVPFRIKLRYYAGLLVALAAPYVFRNLYLHEYYPCAIVIFVIASIGFVAADLSQRPGWRAVMGWSLSAALISSCVCAYDEFYTVQRRNYLHETYATLAGAIQKGTGPRDVLLVYGNDWSSEIPFAVKRRAIMDGGGELLGTPRMEKELEELKKVDMRIGALLLCKQSGGVSEPEKKLQLAHDQLGISKDRYYRNEACEVYLRESDTRNPRPS